MVTDKRKKSQHQLSTSIQIRQERKKRFELGKHCVKVKKCHKLVVLHLYISLLHKLKPGLYTNNPFMIVSCINRKLLFFIHFLQQTWIKIEFALNLITFPM